MKLPFLTTTSTPRPQTLEALIGVKNIADGIIKVHGTYVILLDVTPSNFRLKSTEEQDYIIEMYKGVFNVLKCPFQITSLAMKADTSAHAEYMRDIGRKNMGLMSQIDEYCSFVKEIATKDAVSRRFIVAIPFPVQKGVAMSAEAAKSWLYEKQSLISDILGRCGNDVKTFNDADRFSAEVLYQLLNRSTAERQQFPEKANTPFGVKRKGEKDAYVKGDFISFGGKKRGISPWLEFIYPTGIDATKHDCVIVGESFVSCYLAVNYSQRVNAAWLSELISAGEGIELSIYFEPVNKAKVMRELPNIMGQTKYKLSQGDTQADSDVQMFAMESAKYIRRGLTEGDELWNMHMLIRVYANDREELRRRCISVETTLSGQSIAARPTHFLHTEAFISSLPLGHFNDYFKTRPRNVLATDLASTYPFVAYELSDPEGVFFGINSFNQSPVMLDIFNTNKYSNANVVIVGESGSGKTYATQVLAHRLYLQNIPVYLICPLKGHEYERLCVNLGGSFLRIAPGSKHTINIMDIRPSTSDNPEDSLLAAKLQKLRIFFSLMLPDFDYRIMQYLDEVFIKVYDKYGITKDNASIYVNRGDDFSFNPKLVDMPKLEDVYSEMEKHKTLKEHAPMLRPYVSGSLSYFNGHTNVDLDNNYIVADISKVSGDSMALAMFTALDLFWDRIKEDPTMKKALILDEVWRLIGAGGNQLTATFVLEVYKIIRGYGGAGISATQDIKDFFGLDGGKYGRGIINSSSIKMIMRTSELEREELNQVLRLSSEEQRRITRCSKGDGLLVAGSNRVALHVSASSGEHDLITTDRKDLERLKEEERLNA